MANDGEVNIGTKVDESGLDKGGSPSLLKNQNARRKWFEVAKAERLKAWERGVQNELN